MKVVSQSKLKNKKAEAVGNILATPQKVKHRVMENDGMT